MKTLTLGLLALLISCLSLGYSLWPRERLAQGPPLPQTFCIQCPCGCTTGGECLCLSQVVSVPDEPKAPEVVAPDPELAVKPISTRPRAPQGCRWKFNPEDPRRWYLYRGDVMLGGWDTAQGYYRSWNGATWGARSDDIQLTSAARGELGHAPAVIPASGPSTIQQDEYSSGGGCSVGNCGVLRRTLRLRR